MNTMNQVHCLLQRRLRWIGLGHMENADIEYKPAKQPQPAPRSTVNQAGIVQWNEDEDTNKSS